MASTVDVSGSVRFDLQSGTVQLADDEKGVVVPVAVLSALVKSASPDARAQVGRDLGAHLGRGIARRAGSGRALLEGDMEHVATLLAAELAVAGLGTCDLERWGRALVVHVVDGSAEGGTSQTRNASPSPWADFLTHVVEGAFSAATGRALACARLGDENGLRVLVTNEGAAARVRGWIDAGTSYADALVRLQTGGGNG